MTLWRAIGRGVALALALAVTGPALAQEASPAPGSAPTVAPAAGQTNGLTKSQTAGQTTTKKSISVTPPGQDGVDYAAWELLATRAERAAADPATSDKGLELLRGQLVDWRSKLQAAQNTNASRVQGLRDQISALGPVPAEGATEAPEIADRRTTLNDQLQRLEAPRRAAEEAYRRASGLIAEIDSELRDRQTAQLLKLWPTPANPVNWDDAAKALGTALVSLGTEVQSNWNREARRTEMIDVLPVSAITALFALLLIFRGRRWIERFANWLNSTADSASWRRVWSFLASLGQILVPAAGVLLISVAAMITQMPGWLGQQVLTALPLSGLVLFLSYWLAGRVFPRAECAAGPLQMSPETCDKARFLITSIGFVQGVELLRDALLPAALVPEMAIPVLALPTVLVLSLLLWRFGQLLNAAFAPSPTREELSFRDGVTRFVGKILIAIAVVAPLLAVVGYTTAAQALIFPAASSLTLAGLLLVLVQLIGDIWRALLGEAGEGEGNGLIPVLAGFLLTLASLPLFALLWGARVEDLGELWNRFTEGFMLGETRISPSNFLYFLILFILGFGATRLFQGALRSTILPKTRLDQGGRNAIISGTGYVGIFLAVIIAVSAAGIDLSGLAIVASALSVGIGFGLQNIVQNFVSGIILLIERPVSEGDWIEVGGVAGTVQSISVRSTRIQTFDRSDIIVPNGDLVSQQVTNWTRFSLAGRVIVPVGVDYGSDTRKVSEVLKDIAEAHPLVILEPPPMIAFVGLGADSLNFEIRMIIRDVNFSMAVRTEINHRIVERFREEGIQMPFSQRDIWLRNPEAVAEALSRLHVELPPGLLEKVAAARPAPGAPGTPLRADEYDALAPENARHAPRDEADDPSDSDEAER
ncbi:DUF3772 domain-containing protein [Gemmobacter caeruleus]|uniref:DUF3772 domain-containing protein n=1 Tax=Gemmobacter caeruleus TaxID=2595004 RepID=UPI001396A34F|nr:DUF3772 domain-containing protein [Gemmobacter caeruleus]